MELDMCWDATSCVHGPCPIVRFTLPREIPIDLTLTAEYRLDRLVDPTGQDVYMSARVD